MSNGFTKKNKINQIFLDFSNIILL